jgi:organic radical activating enzyme
MSDDGSIPGKDLNLDSLAAFITRSFKGRKLTVLLNGGEPTLNPGLERFCSTVL